MVGKNSSDRQSDKAGRVIDIHKARRKRRSRRSSNRRKTAAFFWAAGIIAAVFCLVWFVRVDKISVEGNEFYTDDEIIDAIFEKPSDLMTAVLWVKEHFKEHVEIPFVSSYDISFESPTSVRVIVYEHTIIGCLYYLDTYMYFDNNGMIAQSSTKRSDDVVLVTGLNFSSIALYDNLSVEDEGIFTDILRVSQLLKIYGIKADQMQIDGNYNLTLTLKNTEADDGNTLVLEGVKVYLGDGEYIEEKMSELADMISSLDGLSGTLNLDNYDPGKISSGYIFESEES